MSEVKIANIFILKIAPPPLLLNHAAMLLTRQVQYIDYRTFYQSHLCYQSLIL